jgi:hypothetical protein
VPLVGGALAASGGFYLLLHKAQFLGPECHSND